MKRKIAAAALIGLMLVITSCSGKKQPGEKRDDIKSLRSESPSAMGKSAADSMVLSKQEEDKEAPEEAEKKDENYSLQYAFVPRTDSNMLKGRYLEYSISLYYRTAYFDKSRSGLLRLIEKYGFIVSENASEGQTMSMNIQANIKSGNLYDMIDELGKMGSLVSESISAADHTGERVWDSIKSERERARIERKNRVIEGVPGVKRTWEDIEASLEASEDAVDQAVYRDWTINDLVSWAKFNITLEGPKKPDGINMPDFRNAGIAMINILIGFSYYLVIVSPFIVITAVILWKRKAIIGIFRGKPKD